MRLLIIGDLGGQIGAASKIARDRGAKVAQVSDIDGAYQMLCDGQGADIIMIESEGITENVAQWNTSAAASIINGVGLESVMFEAADPPVFEWYIKNYGNEVNLFVDHSQVLQLEGLRQNIWGNKSTWGRIINPAPLND